MSQLKPSAEETRGMTPLNLAEFHEANQERAPFFPSACQGWILAQWGNALAGEVGEACNVIKKIDRGDFSLDEARDDLAGELADAFTYLDHIAAKAGIDLGAAVIRKFNVVSERRGLPHRIPAVRQQIAVSTEPLDEMGSRRSTNPSGSVRPDQPAMTERHAAQLEYAIEAAEPEERGELREILALVRQQIEHKGKPDTPIDTSDWPRRFAAYAFDIDGYDSLSNRDIQTCHDAAQWARDRVAEVESVRQQIEKPQVFVGAIPRRASDDPQVLEAVIIERLNLERDGPASPWWLPADPAPIQCATVADAFREYAGLVDREAAANRAEINSLRQQIAKGGES